MGARHRWLCLVGLLAATFAGVPAAAQRDEPLPRFQDPVCPGIVGLRQDAAEMMVGRIRENAEELGIRLADAEGCEPNLLVVFLEDGQDYLRRLSAERSYMFEDLNPQERRNLLAHEGPVHVLTQVRTRSRDGMIVPRRENLVDPPQTEMWMAHSRIYTPTRKDIVSSLVLIDRDEVGGMGVSQLADFATMRVFTADRPELRPASSSSILNLFDAPEAERPAGLTASDRAVLSTLYQGPANLRASSRLAELEQSRTAPDAE